MQPEGDVWYKIDTPPEVEFNQLSCSPSTGLLWAVSWEGRLFCRTGQAKTDYIGSGWAELPAPSPELRFLNVALGDRVAWAITMDGRAWFARLNNDNPMPLSENAWLDMTCSMSCLSVGPMDQVFGIGLVDDTIYYRTDVTDKELGGRTWQAILTPTSNLEKEEIIEYNAEGAANVITVFDNQQESNNFLKRALASPGILTCVPLVVKYKRKHTNDDMAKIQELNDIGNDSTNGPDHGPDQGPGQGQSIDIDDDDDPSETDKESAFSEDVSQSITATSELSSSAWNEEVESGKKKC